MDIKTHVPYCATSCSKRLHVTVIRANMADCVPRYQSVRALLADGSAGLNDKSAGLADGSAVLSAKYPNSIVYWTLRMHGWTTILPR